MLVGKEADANAFEIHDADHAVVQHQRDSHLRTHVGMRRDIARIRGHVGDADDLSRQGGGTGQTVADFDVVDGRNAG